jgi:RNA polymerase sigma-70 factor (sigma-E family)
VVSVMPGTDAAAGENAPLAFEAYVAARGAGLLRFAALLTGDPHRAEDLVQDALAQAYLRWDRIRRADQPDVYVRRVLVNGSRRWWRRRGNRELPVEQTAEREAPGDISAETAERDSVRRMIAKLPHRQRAVLVLRYYEDLDDATIAEILDCSTVTVRTHAMRALQRLREGHASKRGGPEVAGGGKSTRE